MNVLRYRDCKQASLSQLLKRYTLKLECQSADTDIEGSFWGDEEAGLVGRRVICRPDTPVHSILHESCHFICMSPGRRAALNTDAGGDYDEENGVCYLQILLAEQLQDYSSKLIMNDMDTWGYSFRLGSARAWFEADAEDARQWLLQRKLIDQENQPTFELAAY